MEDIRCPLCGKGNPPESEVCQYCQARLKPLIAPPESGDAASPDWLASLRQGSRSEALPPEEPDDVQPDWATEDEGAVPWPEDLPAELFDPSEPAGPGWDEAQALPNQAEDEPEWLRRIRARQEADQVEPDLDYEEESFTDPGMTPEVPLVLKESADPDEDLAWLDQPAATEAGSLPPTEAEEQVPDWLNGLVEDDPNLVEPDRSARQEGGASLEAPETRLFAPDGEEPVFDPVWQTEQDAANLSESETSEEEGEEEDGVPPLTLGAEIIEPENLPDWLNQEELPEESGESPVQPGTDAEPGLEPAVLPSWLEAMRPVEAADLSAPIQDETDRSTESTGPLSGLSGVLPAERDISKLKKPGAYSIRLHLSERQQAHVQVLEELIQAEGTPKPVPRQAVISSQSILRWLIFAVLFIGIAWPVFRGSRDVALPDLTPEAFDTSTVIDSLPEGVPVLLAVDYSPGLSAEMDAAAGAVVDHLMLKGSYLVLVSTSPTGPAQAERLLKSVNLRGGHQYQDIQQYANLGFIPGGAAGLLAFAEAPRRFVPYGLSASSVWEAPALQGITRFSQFGLVTVITESPETAQAWIEQVQPSLGETPMLMVVSAQAEPIVRPYYEGQPKQVQGMVAGLPGGAAYEALINRDNLSRKYWDAFSHGLVITVCLILLGSAATAVLSNRTRLPKKVDVEGEIPA